MLVTQAGSDVVQVHLDGLVSLYSGLAAALSEAGFTATRLNETLSKHIRGECVQCGIRITGDDIAHVALAGDKTESPDSRLSRLRQGYCARNGCDSYYYRVHFEDCPGVDWVNLREKAGSRVAGAQTMTENGTAKATTTNRNQLLIRLGVSLAVVLILLLFWHI